MTAIDAMRGRLFVGKDSDFCLRWMAGLGDLRGCPIIGEAQEAGA